MWLALQPQHTKVSQLKSNSTISVDMLLIHRFQSNITLSTWLALLINRDMLHVLRQLHKLKIPKLETEQKKYLLWWYANDTSLSNVLFWS